MSYRKKLALGFFMILILVALLIVVPRGKTINNSGPRPAAPPYGVPGSHPVGIRNLVTDSDTPLAMTMWYPALPDDDTRAAAITYPYEVKMGAPVGTVEIASLAGQGRQNAALALARGPYPLVILSPGFSMGSMAYAWLAEHLASYGFVVIAPEHQETLDPENELWRAAVTRPQDILTVLAYVDAEVEPGGALEGLIDAEGTAVIGHSYGGYTALAAAGAQIDTASFEAHCADAFETAHPSVWLCDMLLPHLADMADLADLDAVPEGLWPTWADPRVAAIVPMAGDAFFFGQPGLANIGVPVLAMGGTLDSDTPFLWGPQPAYDHANSSNKALLALHDAEHMIFTNPCVSIRWYAKLLVGEFCSDSVWNRTQAHDLISHFTTAFLLAELQQDATAAAALMPEAVLFPDVTYAAQGY